MKFGEMHQEEQRETYLVVRLGEGLLELHLHVSDKGSEDGLQLEVGKLEGNKDVVSAG